MRRIEKFNLSGIGFNLEFSLYLNRRSHILGVFQESGVNHVFYETDSESSMDMIARTFIIKNQFSDIEDNLKYECSYVDSSSVYQLYEKYS